MRTRSSILPALCLLTFLWSGRYGAAIAGEPAPGNPIAIRTPVAGTHVAVGDTLRIGWRVDLEQVTGLVFSVSVDSGRNWFVLNGNAVIPQTDTGTFAWQIPPRIGSDPSPTTQARVRINDYNKPLEVTMEGTFTIRGSNRARPRRVPPVRLSFSSHSTYHDLSGRTIEYRSPGRTVAPGILVERGATPALHIR